MANKAQCTRLKAQTSLAWFRVSVLTESVVGRKCTAEMRSYEPTNHRSFYVGRQIGMSGTWRLSSNTGVAPSVS